MIATFYGVPGCGKTSIFACIAQLNKRKKNRYYKRVSKSKLYKWLSPVNTKSIETLASRKVLLMIKYYKRLKFKQKLQLRWTLIKCNVPIFIYDLFYKKNFYDVIYCTDETVQDTVWFNIKSFGKFKPTPNSLFLIDEGGILLSNRNWKALDKSAKDFACIHRHALCDICIASQSADIDVSFRNRAEKVFHVTKLGPFTLLRRIAYQVDVDEATHQLGDMYMKVPFLMWLFESLLSMTKKNRYAKVRWTQSYFIYRPFWYKYFDSYIDNTEYTELDPYLEYLDKLEKQELIDNEDFNKY